MKKNLNATEIALYKKAIGVCKKLEVVELEVVDVMKELDEAALYKSYGYKSLFKFSMEELNLTEPVIYTFIGVARKCAKVPALYEGLKAQRLNVSRASRIASVLTNENAETFIRFAETLTYKELNFEVAKLRPKKDKRPDVKPVSGDKVRISVTVPRTVYEEIKRAESLMAQKGLTELDLAKNIAHVYQDYLNRHDPVRKAKRAQKRRAQPGEVVVAQAPPQPENTLCRKVNREPFTAEQKHAVYAKTNGCCTFKYDTGKLCGEDRYMHIHHIRPVSKGGSNDPSNLTLLCSFHHAFVHEESFPTSYPTNRVLAREVMYQH